VLGERIVVVSEVMLADVTSWSGGGAGIAWGRG